MSRDRPARPPWSTYADVLGTALHSLPTPPAASGTRASRSRCEPEAATGGEDAREVGAGSGSGGRRCRWSRSTTSRAWCSPSDHRLAGKESVSVDDITDEPLPYVRGRGPGLGRLLAPRALHRRPPHTGRSPHRRAGGQVRGHRGRPGRRRLVGCRRQHAAPRPHHRPPRRRAEPSRCALATRAGDCNHLVVEFAELPAALLEKPVPTV